MILGIMLFFSFAVAPIIFKVLKEKDARRFVRTIFPYYYCINLILVSFVCIFLFYKDFINFDFYLLISVAILFAISLSLVCLLTLILVFLVPKFEYIKIRLMSFLDTSTGNNYQADRASDAISSGGFFGKGIGRLAGG